MKRSMIAVVLSAAVLVAGLANGAHEGVKRTGTLRVPACPFMGGTLVRIAPAEIPELADRLKGAQRCSIAPDRPSIMVRYAGDFSTFGRVAAGEKFTFFNPSIARCLVLTDRMPAEITIRLDEETFTVPLASKPCAKGDELANAYIGALQGHLSSGKFVPANGEIYYRLTVLKNRSGATKNIDIERSWRRGSDSELVELFELTSGTLAMEQSLQLNAGRDVSTGKTTEPRTVPVAGLAAPKLKTHDFTALLKNRKPVVPHSARMVPHDALFLRFGSIAAALNADDLSNSVRNHVPLFTRHVAPPDDMMLKALTHLGLKKPNPVTRRFYGLAIGEISVVLQDPYMIEGADMAFIIEVKSDALFDRQIKSYRDDFRKRFPGTTEDSSSYGGITVTRFASPGGEVRAHSFRHGKFTVIATSMPFTKRIIDTINGNGRSAADNPDYRYLLAIHGGGGDAFLYVGDDFVARIVSAPFKINELRRVNCEANLKLVRWAVNLRIIEKGAAAPLDGLVKEGYLSRAPGCPCGGEYSIEGGTPRCSRHGGLGQLLTLSANEVANVSESEAMQYKRFVENYHRYWRTYIDPIGISAGIGSSVKFRTVILPLVENTEYDLVSAIAGGVPLKLQALSLAPGDTVFHLAAKLKLFDGYRADLSHLDNPTVKKEMQHAREGLQHDYPDFKGDFLGWIGTEFDFFFLDFKKKEDANAIDPRRFNIEKAGLDMIAARLAVSDGALAGALFRMVLPRLAKGTLTEDAKLGGPLLTFSLGRRPACLLLRKDGLWAASSVNTLRDIVAQSGGMFKKSLRSKFGLGDTKGNFEAGIYPANMKNMWLLMSRLIHMAYADRCDGEMRRLDAAVLLADPTAVLRETAPDGRRLFPGEDPPACPLGGTYLYSKGNLMCSKHPFGAKGPASPATLEKTTPLETLALKVKHFFTRLAFTPEGIDTEIIFKNPAD